MAHKKAGGSTKNGRDSHAKRLGLKCFGGQRVAPGYILLRQRGTSVHPGTNVRKGRDDTLFSTVFGYVSYVKKTIQLKTKKKRSYVHVTTQTKNAVV